MTYYIYHIPGKKIGVTRNLQERVTNQQGYEEGEYESENVDMEGEDEASAEFVRKENKIYVYSDHIPNVEELVKALIHEFVHYLQSESWMQRYYKSGGYEYHNHPYEVKAKDEEKNWQKFI